MRTKAVLVVAFPALALVGSAAGLFVLQQQASARDAAVAESVAMDDQTRTVQQLLVDAETGVRGYLATHDARFLAPQLSAARRLTPAITRLQQLADDSTERALSARIAQLTVGEADTLRLLKALPSGSAVSSRLVALAVSGKATMDTLRASVNALTTHEAQMEQREDRDHAAAVRWVKLSTLLLVALGLAGGIGGSGVVMAGLVRRVREVERNARRLAAGEPLKHVEGRARDEIASLAAALDESAHLLADQRRRLQLALEVGQINIWEVDRDGRMRMQGDRATDYGDTMEAGLSTLLAEDAQQVRDAVAAVRADGTPRTYEVRNATDGRTFAGNVTRSSDNDVIAVSIDITPLRQAQEALRQSEARRAADALADSERRGRHHALMIGSAGEGIVSADASGICISANPAAARLLGYEVSDLVGQSLHALIHHSRPDGTPYPAADCPMQLATVDGNEARIDNEVFWRRDGSRLPVDYTVSPLTEDGFCRGVVVTFTDATDRHDSNAELERAAACLRTAIRHGDLRLFYQPKIHLPSGRCTSVEALVRWQREDALVFPDQFIPTAEQTGVIHELTDWVICEAARQAATWRDDGHDLRVAVNLSTMSLTDDRIVNTLVTAADAHRLPVSRLEVELTESALAAEPDSVVAVLAQLGKLGVNRAIDDFGSGYSSLSYLKHLPVSTIKIDKSFVMNMPQDSRDQAIVATVHMAHSLGLEAIAEGVENDLVLRMLRRADCDTGQGYHWTRPIPADDLANWLTSYAQPQAAGVNR